MPSSQSGKEERNYESEQYAHRVPTTPIRIAVEKYLKESETSLTAMAKDLGLIMPSRGRWKIGDYSSLQRMLGMQPEKQRHGPPKPRQSMQYENAVKIIRYIGRDPW